MTTYRMKPVNEDLLLKAIMIILGILLLWLMFGCVVYTDADRFDSGVEVYQAKQGGIYEIDTIQ